MMRKVPANGVRACFQVDPRYESRLQEIRERWKKLYKNTGSLREQDKRAALGTEVWASNLLAKVSSASPPAVHHNIFCCA